MMTGIKRTLVFVLVLSLSFLVDGVTTNAASKGDDYEKAIQAYRDTIEALRTQQSDFSGFYYLYDFDDDDVPECILCDGTSPASTSWRTYVYAWNGKKVISSRMEGVADQVKGEYFLSINNMESGLEEAHYKFYSDSHKIRKVASYTESYMGDPSKYKVNKKTASEEKYNKWIKSRKLNKMKAIKQNPILPGEELTL